MQVAQTIVGNTPAHVLPEIRGEVGEDRPRWPTRETVKSFWDFVARSGIYEIKPMTNEFEEELDALVEFFGGQDSIQSIVCFGAADGCRDPQILLEEAEREGRTLHRVSCVEVTTSFESKSRRRVAPFIGRGVLRQYKFVLNREGRDLKWRTLS